MVLLFIVSAEPQYTPPVSMERKEVTEWKAAVEMSEQLKSRQEQKKLKRTMDTSIIISILSFMGTVAIIIYNPKFLKLEQKIDKIHDENKEHYTEIKQELKVINTPDKLESSLRQMASGKLESCRPGLREFINSESERLIDVANEIMRGSFNYSSLSQCTIKLELAEAASLREACKLGKEFCDLYKVHVSGVAQKLRDDLSDIILDEIYNSKHSRFSLACQIFLRDHLHGIIDIYEDVA
jgi:hypothetical protein